MLQQEALCWRLRPRQVEADNASSTCCPARIQDRGRPSRKVQFGAHLKDSSMPLHQRSCCCSVKVKLAGVCAWHRVARTSPRHRNHSRRGAAGDLAMTLFMAQPNFFRAGAEPSQALHMFSVGRISRAKDLPGSSKLLWKGSAFTTHGRSFLRELIARRRPLEVLRTARQRRWGRQAAFLALFRLGLSWYSEAHEVQTEGCENGHLGQQRSDRAPCVR